VTDGKVREVQQTDGDRFVLSPDGRFIAIADVGAVRRLGKISVVPSFVGSSQGGPPQLAADNARLMDWTRDGRYLAIVSQRSSSPEALYLLPMKDGRPASERSGLCPLRLLQVRPNHCRWVPRLSIDSRGRRQRGLAWDAGCGWPLNRLETAEVKRQPPVVVHAQMVSGQHSNRLLVPG